MSDLSAYSVVGCIGSGTFGRVHKIRRVVDGMLMVWKELYYGGMNEKEKQQLVAEVNILRELNHPNIVRYHDRIIDREHKKIYIVMEYCPCGDLGTMIKQKKKQGTFFDVSFIWKVLAETASALQECHRRSFLHRDLKPGNIFLDGYHHVKLGDFGLARILSASRSFATTHAGTPYYMSPEQIIHSFTSSKSDVWSLGCLLYELCSLSPPFLASNPLSLARRIEKGEWDERSISIYGLDMLQCVRGMLTVSVEERWSIEQVLQHCQRVRESIKKRNTERDRLNSSPSTILSSPSTSKSTSFDPLILQKHENALAERERKVIERESLCDQREQELNKRELLVSEREEIVLMLIKQNQRKQQRAASNSPASNQRNQPHEDPTNQHQLYSQQQNQHVQRTRSRAARSPPTSNVSTSISPVPSTLSTTPSPNQVMHSFQNQHSHYSIETQTDREQQQPVQSLFSPSHPLRSISSIPHPIQHQNTKHIYITPQSTPQSQNNHSAHPSKHSRGSGTQLQRNTRALSFEQDKENYQPIQISLQYR